MQFLKKHYEKIILSVVLLALAGTAFWLSSAIDQKRTELNQKVTAPTKPKKVLPIDLAPYQKALDRLKAPPSVSFSTPHHIFNPVTWKQRSDGTLFKIPDQDLPRIVKINPLHLIISFKRTAGTAGNVTGYNFGITKEAAFRPADRKSVERYVSATGKKDTDLFTLKEVQGPVENPTGFVLILNDSKKEVVVTPAESFQRVEGFGADLKYDVENKPFNDSRVGSMISFGGETYKIVAITENEVTVQAISNQKQTTIKWKGLSEPK